VCPDASKLRIKRLVREMKNRESQKAVRVNGVLMYNNSEKSSAQGDHSDLETWKSQGIKKSQGKVGESMLAQLPVDAVGLIIVKLAK
jgi:hypothetical protein